MPAMIFKWPAAMMRRMAVVRFILLVFFVCLTWPPLCAHVIQDLYAEAGSDGTKLRFDIILDASYATPEGNLPDKPQPPRDWLYTLNAQQHEAMRRKSELIARSVLELCDARGEPIDCTVGFPDYDTPMPEFPERLSGGAYLTVRLEAALPEQGEITLRHVNRAYPFFVIKLLSGGKSSAFVNLYPEEPGQKLPFQRTAEAAGERDFPEPAAPGSSLKSFFYFLKNGFHHVIPAGWDHILFILALCLLSLKWKPLLHQSLLFTLAHSITLGLAVAGKILVFPRIIEPLIALSIAWMALENLFEREVTRFRIVMIFAFGLIHGMGFGAALAGKIQDSGEFGTALFASNLGVEVAQVTVIGAMLVVFGKFRDSPGYGRVRLVMSSAIAAAGLWLFILRVV